MPGMFEFGDSKACTEFALQLKNHPRRNKIARIIHNFAKLVSGVVKSDIDAGAKRHILLILMKYEKEKVDKWSKNYVATLTSNMLTIRYREALRKLNSAGACNVVGSVSKHS